MGSSRIARIEFDLGSLAVSPPEVGATQIPATQHPQQAKVRRSEHQGTVGTAGNPQAVGWSNKQTRILSTKQSWKRLFRFLTFKTMTSNQDILVFLKANQEAHDKEKEEDKKIRSKERQEDRENILKLIKVWVRKEVKAAVETVEIGTAGED